jgi:hypothetical protein
MASSGRIKPFQMGWLQSLALSITLSNHYTTALQKTNNRRRRQSNSRRAVPTTVSAQRRESRVGERRDSGAGTDISKCGGYKPMDGCAVAEMSLRDVNSVF